MSSPVNKQPEVQSLMIQNTQKLLTPIMSQCFRLNASSLLYLWGGGGDEEEQVSGVPALDEGCGTLCPAHFHTRLLISLFAPPHICRRLV